MKHSIHSVYFALFSIAFCSLSKISAHGFVSDTLVRTAAHHIAIQDVTTKNYLVGYDTKTGGVSLNAVARTVHTTSDTYYVITVGTTKLITHPQQPFWSVTKKDWVAARDLSVADILLTLTGSICIDEISQQHSARPVTFFTFTVAGIHTFCVTEYDIIVHNVIPESAVLGAEGAAVLVGLPCVLTAPIAIPIVSVLTIVGSLGIFAWQFFKERRERQQKEAEFLLRQQYEPAQEMEQEEQVGAASILLAEQQNNRQKSSNKELPKKSPGGSAADPDDPEEKKKNRDRARKEYRRLTNKEARELADQLGYKEDKNSPFESHGELTFKKGNEWISPDNTGHNGGVWKMFRGARRVGTFNADLTKIIKG